MSKINITVTPDSLRALAAGRAALGVPDEYRQTTAALQAAAAQIERLNLQAAPMLTRTPHATPADVNMLWEAIDQLKARIDALEGHKAASEERFMLIENGTTYRLENGTTYRFGQPE